MSSPNPSKKPLSPRFPSAKAAFLIKGRRCVRHSGIETLYRQHSFARTSDQIKIFFISTKHPHRGKQRVRRHSARQAESLRERVSPRGAIGRSRQTVKVKILTMSDDGKINLSIKKAEERPAPAPVRKSYPPRQETARPAPAPVQAAAPATSNQDFEDRLKKFMQESDSRIADNRRYAEHKQRSRRR